jgi:hypothetical protein
MKIMSDAQTSATNTSTSDAVTIDTIRDALRRIPKDPIAEYMRTQGVDPDKGCKLLLPPAVFDRLSFTSGYIQRHPCVAEPMLYKPMRDYLQFKS